MSDTTVQAVKSLIRLRLPKLNSLQVTWFGGEPLIAKDIVTDITRFAQEAAASMDVDFSSDMTTNAYTLNKATFESLLRLDVRAYQISLDGDEDEHDKTRKLISSKGTFTKIWSNLVSLKTSSEQFKIDLRVHLHRDNLSSVRSLLTRINNEFGHDPRFSIFMKAVGNWGGESVKQLDLIQKPDDVLAELKAHLEQIGWNTARKSKTEAVDVDKVKACYAALPSSLVVRADGSLAKCTVAFNDPRNRIGTINNDGTLSLETPSMQNFMRGFRTLDVDDLLCPMKKMPPKVQPIQFHPNSGTTANENRNRDQQLYTA